MFFAKNFKSIDTKLLARYCVMNRDNEIMIGIKEDFSATSDTIWHGKKIDGAKPEVSSTWGTPVIYDATKDVFIPCWKKTFGPLSWGAEI